MSARSLSIMELASRLERDALALRDCAQEPAPGRLAVASQDLTHCCRHLASTAEGWAAWLKGAAAEAAVVRQRGLLEGDLAAVVDRAHKGLIELSEALSAASATGEPVPEALTAFGRLT